VLRAGCWGLEAPYRGGGRRNALDDALGAQGEGRVSFLSGSVFKVYPAPPETPCYVQGMTNAFFSIFPAILVGLGTPWYPAGVNQWRAQHVVPLLIWSRPALACPRKPPKRPPPGGR
jgi:hypothetical protein